MAKKKNLSLFDSTEVEIAEEILEKIHSNRGYRNSNGNHKLDLSSVSLKIKCFNEKQKELRRAIEEKQIVIITGPAGTGKTYMSLLTALSVMKKDKRYQHLKLVKSLQKLPNEDPGLLPGTLEEKLTPHMYSYIGNLDKILGRKDIRQELFNNEIIEYMPLAYIRGVTMDNQIIIIDEIQNIDMCVFKTIITRIGKNCKMIFLGDPEQIDRKNKKESCLFQILKIFKDFEPIASINFTDEESVRNPIIPQLLKLLKDIK